MRNILSITLLSVCVLFSFAVQSQRTISGTISDGSSGEPVFGAMVFDTLSRQGTVANEYGFFSLTVPDGPAVLRVSYYGFERQFITIPSTQSELNLELSSSVKEIDEVVVNASDSRKSTEQTNAGTFELSLDKVEKLPVFMEKKTLSKRFN